MKKTHTTVDPFTTAAARRTATICGCRGCQRVDLSMANLSHAFSELRANALHGVLKVFYGVYHKHREGTLVKNEAGRLVRKKTPIHLPPLSQGVKKELLDGIAFLTFGLPPAVLKEELAANPNLSPEIANFTQAEEQALAIIEKSFNELPPKVQEIVAKVLHRKSKESLDRSCERVRFLFLTGKL